jgi:hypothetical protein
MTASPEFYILFLIALVNGQKDLCVFIIIGQYVGLFGVAQPMLHLAQRSPQATHPFLACKYLVISVVVFIVLALHETSMIQQSPYFGLLYPTVFLLYLIGEALNSMLVKTVFSLLMMYSESDLFKYPKNKNVTENELRSTMFFEVAKEESIQKLIDGNRTRKEQKQVQSKFWGLWTILRGIVRAKNHRKTLELVEERRQKIDLQFKSLLAEKHDRMEEERKQREKAKENHYLRFNSLSQLPADISETNHHETRPAGYHKPSELVRHHSLQKHVPKQKDDSYETNFSEVFTVVKLRFQGIEWPSGVLPRVNFVTFLPFYLLFSMTIPSMKTKISTRQAYFGLLACITFLIGLVTLLYLVVNDSTRYWRINPGLTSLIYSLLGLNYFIYCRSLGNAANRFFNISIQEMLIVQIALLMTISSLNDILFTQLTVSLSLGEIGYPLLVLVGNSVLFAVLSVIFAERIPWPAIQVFVVVLVGYVLLVTLGGY